MNNTSLAVALQAEKEKLRQANAVILQLKKDQQALFLHLLLLRRKLKEHEANVSQVRDLLFSFTFITFICVGKISLFSFRRNIQLSQVNLQTILNLIGELLKLLLNSNSDYPRFTLFLFFSSLQQEAGKQLF